MIGDEGQILINTGSSPLMSQEGEALQELPSPVPPSPVPPSAVPSSAVPVSVVVEEEPPPLSLLQPINMKNDSNRIENEKRNEKVSFRTLLDLTITFGFNFSFFIEPKYALGKK
jgi:hypothetical protein